MGLVVHIDEGSIANEAKADLEEVLLHDLVWGGRGIEGAKCIGFVTCLQSSPDALSWSNDSTDDRHLYGYRLIGG
jgi:hypothetical protein